MSVLTKVLSLWVGSSGSCGEVLVMTTRRRLIAVIMVLMWILICVIILGTMYFIMFQTNINSLNGLQFTTSPNLHNRVQTVGHHL